MTTSTTDPDRLSNELAEGGSSLERALLKAGSSYASSPQTRVKVLAGLGLAVGSTAVFTGSAAAASAATAAKFTWAKLLVGASLVGATAVPVGYYALRSTSPATPPAHRAVMSTPAAAEPAPPATAQEAAADAVAAARAATLAEELQALDHARLALANGDARRTLGALDAYDRRFVGGRLQLEAEVLRIDALKKLGRKDEARQHAEAFLRRHPNSVLATRVRAQLAD
jgi:hypothetical protein